MASGKLLFGKLYGIATIGERGQVVIPMEARRDLGLATGDKVVILSSPRHEGLFLVGTEVMVKLVANAISALESTEERLSETRKETNEPAEITDRASRQRPD